MYTALSKFYDVFMKNVDYDKWTDYVISFLKDKKDGVDLACGTGKFTLALLMRGYNIYGVDISPQMLNEAKNNAAKCAYNANFILGDMQNFEFIKAPQFVLAMCDAVNYLKNPLKTFQNIFNALENNGIFIFDISSEYKLTQILANNTYSDSNGDITYIWNNALSKNKAFIDIELTFFERNKDLFKKSTEHQRQYVHSKENIIFLLEKAGFNDIKVYSNLTKKKPKSTDERIHFVAYKNC